MAFDAASFFSVTALPYELITAQAVWRDHCREMMTRFPRQETAWSVVDVGCGPGNSALAMAAAGAGRVVGIDVAAGMLRRARRARARDAAGGRVSLARADAARLPLRDGAADVVTGHSFLYLTPDPAAILAELHRVLRPGGVVVLLEPSAGAPGLDLLPQLGRSLRFALSMAAWRVVSAMHRRYSAPGLGLALEGAGFRDVEVARTLGGLGLLASGTR